MHAKCFILVHLTLWPEYTTDADRTGRTDTQDRQTDRAGNGQIA